MSEIVDGERLRAVMRHVASPVTVVTFASEAGPRGVTIGSFTSLSLEPPLVCFNLNKESSVYEELTCAEAFVVHILADTQAYLSNHFARSEQTSAEQFASIDHRIDAGGMPRLDGVLAVMSCRRHALFQAGDHTIVVGEVVDVDVAEGAAGPILYYNRSYRGIGAAVNAE